jgi:Flp pilus assembly protein CpaB
MLEKTEIVRRSVVPGSITNPSQIESMIATQAIFAGEQVTTRRFATPAERGVRAQITGTTRAMQVAGDQHQLLAGTLKAGDRVDVVASLKIGEEGDSHVTRTVLRDIEVLKAAATPGVADQNIAGTSEHLFVQLALTDAQAQKMFHVRQHGSWSLELRPPVKANDSPESLTWFGSIIRDGIRPTQLEQLATGGN